MQNDIDIIYIVSLISMIELDNPDTMLESIDLIIEEIAKTEDSILKANTILLKTFMANVLVELDQNLSIDKALLDYKSAKRKQEIVDYSLTHGLDVDVVETHINMIKDGDYTGLDGLDGDIGCEDGVVALKDFAKSINFKYTWW